MTVPIHLAEVSVWCVNDLQRVNKIIKIGRNLL